MNEAPNRSYFTTFKTWATTLRNKMVAGVIVAVPLVVTIWVLNFIFETVAGVGTVFIKPVLREGESPENYLWAAFLLTILLFLALGFIATNVLGRRFIDSVEHLLLRIPFFATVYSGIKQVMDSVKGFNTGMQFQRVAYVDYPATGYHLIGFVTGQFHDPGLKREMTCVFLPTAPNPMTGFVLVVPSEHVKNSSLSMEQATKLIISAGLIGPKAPAMEDSVDIGAPLVPDEAIMAQDPSLNPQDSFGKVPASATVQSEAVTQEH